MSARQHQQERALGMLALVREQAVPRGVPLCTSLYPGLKNEQHQRLHLLVSLLLSSQTRDQVTEDAMTRLRERGGEGGTFSLEELRQLSQQEIQTIIYPVAFYRRKAASLAKLFPILATEYNGDIPESLEECLELPGIGPKMAHLLQSAAWGKTTGIGVDTHVHRLAQLWDWVTPSTNPEKTRQQLEQILPKELWFDVNELLVRFGQNICVPRAPKCTECNLNAMCKGSRVKEDPATGSKRKVSLREAPKARKVKRIELELELDPEVKQESNPKVKQE